MSRNSRWPPTTLPNNRGRERCDLGDLRQAAAELLWGGLGDLGDRYYPSPGRMITGGMNRQELDVRDLHPFRGFRPDDGGQERPAAQSAYRHPRPRATMPGQGKERQPIGKAMKNLHKLLTAAEQTYSGFLESFDNDTEAIKSYATPESLNEGLWNMKVSGKKGNAGGEDASEEGVKFAKRHNETMKKLASALYEAVHSVVDEGQRSRRRKLRVDNGERLRQKVETARTQIMGLLDKVPSDREYCASLLGELRLLMALVDPDEPTETNKALYSSGDCDDDNAASGADGDEQEQGGGGNHWD